MYRRRNIFSSRVSPCSQMRTAGFRCRRTDITTSTTGTITSPRSRRRSDECTVHPSFRRRAFSNTHSQGSPKRYYSDSINTDVCCEASTLACQCSKCPAVAKSIRVQSCNLPTRRSASSLGNMPPNAVLPRRRRIFQNNCRHRIWHLSGHRRSYQRSQ